MTTFNSLRAAAKYAGVTPAAVLYWTDRHDIGTLVNGRWQIDKDKLDLVIAARDHIAELRASIQKSA